MVNNTESPAEYKERNDQWHNAWAKHNKDK